MRMLARHRRAGYDDSQGSHVGMDSSRRYMHTLLVCASLETFTVRPFSQSFRNNVCPCSARHCRQRIFGKRWADAYINLTRNDFATPASSPLGSDESLPRMHISKWPRRTVFGQKNVLHDPPAWFTMLA